LDRGCRCSNSFGCIEWCNLKKDVTMTLIKK
jgi:hypothetical protein